MDLLGPDVPSSGFQEHGLVEAAPDVLGGVDQVLDSARNAVRPGPGRIRGRNRHRHRRFEFYGGRGVCGAREGPDAASDGCDVGGDGLSGGLHEDDGVRGVDEIAVAVADQLPELFGLVGDLLPRRRLHIANFGDGFRSEEGFCVSVPTAAGCPVII